MDEREARLGGRFLGGRGALTAILVGAFVLSLAAVDWRGGVFNTGGLNAMGEIAAAAFQPDLAPDVLAIGARSTWTTIAYAFAGMTVALLIGIPFGVVASGVVFRSARRRRAGVAGSRGALAGFRAVHELVWAWLFVAAIGTVADGRRPRSRHPLRRHPRTHLRRAAPGRPEAPLRALRSAGASEWRVFWFGRLPMALPDMLSYTFYRLECGIRSAAVLSFVGLGGLGHNIHISLQDIDYGRMWTFVYFLIALIVIVDVWSSLLRRRVAVEQG